MLEKTTSAMEYLKNELYCIDYINADSIAIGLSPFQPEKVAVSAGKIMLERIKELINRKVDFSVETTLASKVLLEYIENAKLQGFEVILIFFWFGQ